LPVKTKLWVYNMQIAEVTYKHLQMLVMQTLTEITEWCDKNISKA